MPFQYAKLLGCRRGADGQPEVVPEEAEAVKRIYCRCLDGCSLPQIKRELAEWLDRQETAFTEYEDVITRRYVEKVTVLDAETIQIKFKYTETEIDRAVLA